MRSLIAMVVAGVLTLAANVQAGAPDESVEAAVPLVWESPGCGHRKLGSVEVELGERVSEITQDANAPTVDYARAMKALSAAAAAKAPMPWCCAGTRACTSPAAASRAVGPCT